MRKSCFTFNVFRETEFSQEELFNALCDYRDTVAPRIVESSLKKDVTCILRMYVEQGTAKTGVSEDGLDCPLAIDRSGAERIRCAVHNQAVEWFEYLPSDIRDDYTQALLFDTYPLHSITALVMPMLCTRYAPNDRSLFTFLTSAEPYSFRNFLKETTVEGDVLPTLKLDRVYDYFIEAVGTGLASRPNLQRWVEIQNLIADAKRLVTGYLHRKRAIAHSQTSFSYPSPDTNSRPAT